jgi:glucosamine--fructose-6-phosphate aminotransferase (isomerizing)
MKFTHSPKFSPRLLNEGWANVQAITSQVRQRDFRYVFIVARGTSDNAARYAGYVLGNRNYLPVTLALPSLFSLYNTAPNLRDALVIGVSQSGKSPDIVNVLATARSQGAATLSITNASDSPLALAAEWHIDILAGAEKAVAATKSYTTQLLAFVLLSLGLSGATELPAEVLQLPNWAQQALDTEAAAEKGAARYRFCERSVVVGRGFNYATAFEWSLKLKELTYMVVEPYSVADFRHGPIAVVEPGFPVFSVAPSGVTYPDALSFAQELSRQRKAEQVIISDQPEILAVGQVALALPAGIPEWLSPIVTIIPAQLFAYHLTLVKGNDTEKPRGLSKVTETF